MTYLYSTLEYGEITIIDLSMSIFQRKMVPGIIRRISGEEFVVNDGGVLRQVSC